MRIFMRLVYLLPLMATVTLPVQFAGPYISPNATDQTRLSREVEHYQFVSNRIADLQHQVATGGAVDNDRAKRELSALIRDQNQMKKELDKLKRMPVTQVEKVVEALDE